MTFHIFHIPYYKYLITTKCRELLERILREKTKIDWSTILNIWFSKFLYFHHIHWHTLERFISQILISLYPNQWVCILVLGKQIRDDQFTWLMQLAYCGIRKAKKNTVRLNLVGARSLEGLGALDRLGLEGFLLFMYHNFILLWIIDRLEGGGEVFRWVLRFPFR